MKNYPLAIAGLLIAILFGSLVFFTSALAMAQAITPNSLCSVAATGLMDDGRIWSGVAPRMQVSPDGKWMVCQPWVKDGELARQADAPQPKPCRGVDRTAWTIEAKTCSAGLPPAGHGYASLATQETGPMRGQATYVCRDGAYSIDAARSWCADAPACDRLETIRYGSAESCSVTIDSRRAPRPVGTVIDMPADAKPGWAGSAKMRCEFGGWAFAAEPRCVGVK